MARRGRAKRRKVGVKAALRRFARVVYRGCQTRAPMLQGDARETAADSPTMDRRLHPSADAAPASRADGTGDLAGEQRAIWLYDGVCVLCSRSVQFLIRHEHAPSTVFVAIQSAAGRDIALRHGIDPDEPSTFLFIEGGRALAKSDGVVAMARHLRWPWRALGWSRALPRSLRDGLYDRLAGNRYRIFGRHERCQIPPADQRARFVLPE